MDRSCRAVLLTELVSERLVGVLRLVYEVAFFI